LQTNNDTRTFALKARYVFPVAGEPIADGVVTVQGERIATVGAAVASGAEIEDLGNAALLPGLVNAHTHLDLSHLDRPLGEPGMPFVDWIWTVIEHRLATQPSNSIRRGIDESVRRGVTALGDIGQPGGSLTPCAEARLDSTVFLELIGLEPERITPSLEAARAHVAAAENLRATSVGRISSPSSSKSDAPRRTKKTSNPSPTARNGLKIRPTTARVIAGLSPHAPYSVHPRLLDALVSLMGRKPVPLAMHLAESREELDLLATGSGPFRDLLKGMGLWTPGIFSPGTRPLDYLKRLVRASRALVIHGNYLDDEEIALLAENAGQMSVVYCPRTHAYFGHEPYPLAKMLAAGVNVALGTDSRASSPDLDLLAEIRAAAVRHPDVPRSAVLRLGTLGGARALGRDAELGSLEPGKPANLTAVALPPDDAADPHELLLHGDGTVTGRWFFGAQ